MTYVHCTNVRRLGKFNQNIIFIIQNDIKVMTIKVSVLVQNLEQIDF